MVIGQLVGQGAGSACLVLGLLLAVVSSVWHLLARTDAPGGGTTPGREGALRARPRR